MTDLTKPQYEEFGRKLLEFYLENGFGTQSKSNIDLCIFDLLYTTEYFKDCNTVTDMAIKLRTTSAKMNKLLLQSAFYHGFNVENYRNQILQCLGSPARDLNRHKISFEIDNPCVRMAIKNICVNKKIYTDTSFNTNIISFPLNSYSDLINSFVPKGKEKEFEKALWQEIRKVKWDITRTNIRNSLITEVLLKGIEKIADQTIAAVFPTTLITIALNKIFL